MLCVARKISHPSCLFNNLELDYASQSGNSIAIKEGLTDMEKAEDLKLYKSDGCGCATRIGYVERKTTFNI